MNKEEIEKLYLRIECKKENPKKWGWYNTDKGKLFWYDLENSWSCNDERLSEEYPKYWYKEYSDQNAKPLIEEIAVLRKLHKLGLQALIECQNEKAKLKASKSEDNEAVVFAEWLLDYYHTSEDGMSLCWKNCNPDINTKHTTTELYEIFKTRNNK